MKIILVLDDNESLLELIHDNITKYVVLPSKTLSEALKQAQDNNVDFVAVDYDLGNEETGDMLQEILLKNGETCPGIVFSGKDLSDNVKSFLEKKGFSKIISKVDDEKLVSEMIEEAADEILKDSKKRTFHIRTQCTFHNAMEQPLKFGDDVKTVEEWILMLEDGKIQHGEQELKRTMVKLCGALRKRHDDYQFDSL